MRLIFTIFIMHLALGLFAQPANDECVDRIQLGEVPLCPVMGTFTNLDATPSVISDDPTLNKPACFNGSQPDNDVWFSFIVPADGSAPNLIIEVTPTMGANGPISQPQIAAYRGICGEDELAQVGCASAAFNEDMVTLELFGLNAGDEIFLRIEDWTASATNNAGDFALCIKAPDPIFNIAEDAGSMLCSGQLFDSGGADETYDNNENNEFQICPSANFSCINIEISSYDIEAGFDALNIFAGSSTSDPLFFTFDGTGGPTSFNVSSTCVTVQFTSDGSIVRDGFELNWTCTTGSCENPFSTCGDPTNINSLPYSETDLTTCGTLDAVENGPCDTPGLLDGEDHVFAYASPGDECIMVEVSNANVLTALSIYNDCPDQATDCLGSDVTAVGSNAVVMETYLEEPGIYYIIVDNPDACTEFDIAINTITCANSAPVTCEDPVMVSAIPFTENASTCAATDSEGSNECSAASGPGEDYIYAYESLGGECLTVRVENAGIGTTVSALNGCSSDDPDCFGFSEVTTGDTAVIQLVRITDPGTYYFVVEAPQGCGSFDIEISPVGCPISLPPAVDCENALNINGCGNQPQIINVDQMSSDDETAFQVGVNDGCWSGTGQARYTWFNFQAQVDGNFGFLANNAEDPTISDIDIQVWGPYSSEELACDFMRTNQPIRSTYAAPRVPNLTGLTDVHPATGEAITDICEGAGGDAYVSTIPVLQGEWYLVLVNDFSGTIEMGGINMDFSDTTPGVLAEFGQMATISQDTVTCPGSPVMLEAGGGLAYNWINSEDGLSCSTCPNPMATVTETTEFSVIVSDACNMDTLTVKVALIEAMAGEDQVACDGEPIELSGRPTAAGAGGFWTGAVNALSCVNCSNPSVDTQLLGPGEFSFIYQAGGTECTSMDTVMITILDAVAPDYTILPNTNSCEELSVELGGPADPNASYSWTSNPPGFTSTDSNPSVTVTETITYYLEVSNQTCPRVLMDSVTIMVGSEVVLPMLEDQELCEGESYFLSGSPQSGVTYSWSPMVGVGNPNSLSTSFNPAETTVYTLTTSQDGCISETSFTITVVNDVPMFQVTEDLSACVGTEVVLDAVSNIPGTYLWSDGSVGGSIITNTIIQDVSFTVTFTPASSCFSSVTETINIMALGTPEIDPLPTPDICSADGYQLSGLTVQPGVMYTWTPSTGVSNPNELNTDFNPTDTITYQVIGAVGACADTAFFTLNVQESPVISADPVVAVCPGSDVTLVASANLPGEFTWSPGGQIGPEITIMDVNATLTFTADFIADNGCTVDGTMVTMEVIDAPEIDDLDDQSICTDDEPFELSGLTEQPGVNYSWTPATGVGNPTALNNIFNPTETTTYEITATAGDCSDTQSFTIMVNETPVLTASEIPPACPGSDVTLSASSTVPGEFTWNPFDLTGSEVTIENVNTTLSFTANFVADNGCPVDGIMVEMEVLSGIEIIDIMATPEMDIVEGDMVELVVTTEPDSAITYSWSSGGVGVMEMVTPLETPESWYTVTVTEPNGCTAELAKKLDVEEAKNGIPNAFIPGSRSDINNIFQVEITGGNIEVISMKIWNRFGDLVHEGFGTSHGWNGLIDGKLAPSDVYLYITEIREPDGTLIKKQGDVTLIR